MMLIKLDLHASYSFQLYYNNSQINIINIFFYLHINYQLDPKASKYRVLQTQLHIEEYAPGDRVSNKWCI